MNIKLTPWETRNLGVSSSIEFEVEYDDLWIDISDEIIRHHEEYQVVHVPGGNTDVLLNAPRIGFYPIEMNIQLSRRLDNLELPRIYRRFESVISSNVATSVEEEIILKAIEGGDIFSTDKVARDPLFGNDYAGRRYAYWTADVLEQGAELICMKYKGQIAAFDVLVDRGNGVAEAFLGGVFPQYGHSGLGFMPVFLITKHAIQNEFKKIITGVSSNNLPILKIHELFGYHVEGLSYCLVKHYGSN